MVAVGELIKTIRTHRGLTLEGLAKDTFTVDYLNRIEQSQIDYSDSLIDYLSKRFGVENLLDFLDDSLKETRLKEMLSDYKETEVLDEDSVAYLEINALLPQTVNATLIIFSLLIRNSIKEQDLTKAGQYFELSLKAITDDQFNQDNETLFAFYYLSCGNYYFEKQDYLYADKYYSKAIKLNISGLDLGHANYNLSLTKQRLFNDNSCTAYSKKAAVIYEELEEYHHLYHAYVTIGIQSYNLESYETAIEYFNAALEYMLKIGDKKTTAQIFYNLGHTYQKLKEYKESIDYYEKSLELIEEIENPKGWLYTYRNLCQLYLEINDFDNVVYYLDSAKKLLAEYDYAHIAYQIKGIEAKLELHNGNPEKYEETIKEIIKDCKKMHYFKIIEGFASELGEYYYGQGRFQEASKLLLVALEAQNKLWRRNTV